MYYVEEPFWNVDTIFYTDIDTTKIVPRYVYFCLQREHLEQYNTAGGVPSLTQKVLNKVKLPVPPLEVQREIVRVLDSFTLLTAELTARKKQYKFYRDKLLAFGKDTLNCKLKDICDIFLGLTATPNYTDKGVKFISAQNTSNDFLDLSNVKYISETDFEKATSNAKPQRGDLLFTRVGSNLGHPVIVETDEKLCVFVSLGFLRIRNKEQAIIGYLKHWMNTDLFWSQVRKNVHGAAKVNLNAGWLREFNISLPSLETQQRIVHVLDNFESICTDLNIGLPAEIEARQKQYEYYRDLLLTFAETGSTLETDRQTDRQTELSAIRLIQYVFGYAVVRLDYISDFRNGKGHEKNIANNGKYIVVNSKFISTDGQIKKFSDEQICPLYKNDILMVMSDLPNGRALAKCYLVDMDDRYTLNQRIGAFTVNRSDLITTKYLYYMLNRNSQLLRYNNGADQTNLRKNDILSILIAIPSIEEQKKITDILDRFDTLCNDLSTGLPAEIEARQKQYEYYRDKLLSFKEIQK